MSRTRIVAVDDDRRILRVLKRACESTGYEVHSVLDAEFFETSFRVFEPALVFLDLNMRGIDGVQLLRFMASERTDASIIVTSGVDERLLRDAYRLGTSLGLRMLEPIRKPLVLADLRRRLAGFRGSGAGSPPESVSATELRQAIEQDRITVHYQPLVSLTSGKVVCAEALARLHRPGRADLLPDRFITVAERSGLIEPLTFAVLRRALSDLSTWSPGAPHMSVSVNVSPLLLDDRSLPGRVAEAVAASATAARRLMLEVTETSIPEDRRRMAETLGGLRRAGVHLALDDFGTGFCSLGQLYEFPYQTMKLDKKFAMRAEHDADAAAMIRSSLDLARSVRMAVVAEGIESENVLRWLARLGCDVGQGFHISPPLPADALGRWLACQGRGARRSAAWPPVGAGAAAAT